MARPRQPIELIVNKERSHLGAAVIAERRATEVQPDATDLSAPEGLTEKQATHFELLARQLAKIKIMGDTDRETLARYVIVQEQWTAAAAQVQRLNKTAPKARAELSEWSAWLDEITKADKRLERYTKQASALARDLGMTIASRCKLVLPKAATEPEKPVNKFERFGGNGNQEAGAS